MTLSTSLGITLQNKFLDFLNVEVSASHNFFKRASVWGVSVAILLLLGRPPPTNLSGFGSLQPYNFITWGVPLLTLFSGHNA
jgi:hypothetical protein